MKKIAGFTLIELLIALFIFTILASITAAALHNMLHTQIIVRAQAKKLQQLELMLSLMEQDINAIMQRPIYGDDFQFFPAFIGRSNYIEFSRGGLPNPQGIERRSTLTRVAWLCQNHQLIRRTWKYPDTPHREQYQDRVFLRSIQNCYFAFLDQKLRTWNDWKDGHTADKKTDDPTSSDVPELLPKAVQFNLTTKTFGTGSFLWLITSAVYQHATA